MHRHQPAVVAHLVTSKIDFQPPPLEVSDAGRQRLQAVVAQVERLQMFEDLEKLEPTALHPLTRPVYVKVCMRFPLGIAMIAVCIGADAQGILKCVGMRVVYNCPSDRAPDGRAVTKGKSEVSVVSTSPQAFRAEMKSTVYPGYVMEGTRIGNCEKR